MIQEEKDLTMFIEYPDVLTISEMQKALNIGKTTAYKLITEKKIKHFKIGKIIKIPKLSLIDYVSQECYSGAIAMSEPSCLN